MTEYEITHGLSQDAPGPLEPVEVAKEPESLGTGSKPIAHWYAVDKHGAATLCTCEEDARETAAESAQMFPNCAPYTAVQLAPVSTPTSHPIPTGATGEDEQAAFERWLERTCPSGDVESVQRQWEASSDYADFHAPAAGDALDADPLQGAANWLAQAHGQFSPLVLSACLMIGYNRASRLYDAAIAQQKGEA